MKQASTKKVKAGPAGVDDNGGLGGYSESLHPERKQRVRTAIMASLAISIGASSLLITGQSGRSVAAEPIRNDPTISVVPIPTAVVLNLPINQVQKAGEPVTVNGNVNASLKANYRAKASLAELRSEEANNSSVNNTGLAEPSVWNLQAEIQRLREKYPAQQTDSQADSGDVVVPILAPVPDAITSEAVDVFKSEFRLAQAAELLQPANQEQLEMGSPPVPTPVPQPLSAASPMDVDLSAPLQFLRGQLVSPELPPLAAEDFYLPKPLLAFKGYIWPAKGVLTSPFGWRWGRIHPGIDIAAPIGTPVFAAAAGAVVAAGWNSGGYGNVVDIRHADGSLTRYGHNSRLLVQAGQQVEQGQEIAEMGSTGYSTGPHCHFEVHPPGHGAVNPMAYLPRG